MYYPVLKELKGYNALTENDLNVYDTVLFKVYKKVGNKRFGARVFKIAYESIDYQKWLSVLVMLSSRGLIRVNYELICPNCYNSVETFAKYDEIPFEEEYNCRICGEEFNIEEDLIYLTYNILPELLPSKGLGDDEAQANFFRDPKDSEITPETLVSLVNSSPFAIFERLIDERRNELIKVLREIDTATTNDQKKKSLEMLSERVFDSPYLSTYKKDFNTETGEIDIVFKVRKVPDTIFEHFSPVLLLESKNWETKMSSKEVAAFIQKVRKAQTKVSIIVSKNGLSGDIVEDRDAWGIVKDEWKTNNLKILTFSLEELNKIIIGNSNLYQVLEEKFLNFHIM